MMDAVRRLAVVTLLITLCSDAHGESLRPLADRARQDLLSHWWIGSAQEGHLLATHGGLPIDNGDPAKPKNDPRGVIWERAAMVCALEGLAVATGDTELRQRIQAQWRFDKRQYAAAKLEACGTGTPSPWCDDAGWTLLYYVIAYQQSADGEALDRAKGLVRQMHARWHDEAMGGGLWYNDARKVKSLYGVAFTYGCLGIYEATRESEFLELALQEYGWLEERLLREDGLYWCEHGADGPVGVRRAQQRSPGNSVVYLGGAMGMGACQAYLFQLTGAVKWKAAAVRTGEALRVHLTDAGGRLVNDRDAFTNGIFASFWARRMAGIGAMTEGMRKVLCATAFSVAKRRTVEGFYPADWDGGAVWETNGSTPNKMHVSAMSAAFVFAALYGDG